MNGGVDGRDGERRVSRSGMISQHPGPCRFRRTSGTWGTVAYKALSCLHHHLAISITVITFSLGRLDHHLSSPVVSIYHRFSSNIIYA